MVETTTLITTAPTPRSSRQAKTTDTTAITEVEYHSLQTAFDHMNATLFDGTLPEAFIVYSRRAHSRGHFSDDRYSARDGKFKKPEISLNPDEFIDRTDKQIVSTLVHEMTHLRQYRFGRPSKRGYHNKEFARMMLEIGLMPSNTGAVGGKQTGAQMSHYVIPGGAYEQAFTELAASGWKLNLESAVYAGATKAPPSKVKFSCSVCSANAWAKPDSKLVCEACLIDQVAGLPWLDADKATDLAALISTTEMRAQQAATEKE